MLLYMDDIIPELKMRTRAALGLARAKVLTDARAIVESKGTPGIIVAHLAKAHGVAPLSVRRWLLAAGFDLAHLQRGRPSFQKLAELSEGDEAG